MSEQNHIDDYLAGVMHRRAKEGPARTDESAPEPENVAAASHRILTTARGRIDRQIVDEVPVDSSVLEISCGGTVMAEELRAKGCEVWGVDPRTGVGVLRGGHLDLVIDNSGRRFQTLPDQPASFDVLVVDGSLERMTDPAGVLLDALTFVRPGGLAFLSLPNFAHWRNRLALVFGRSPFGAFPESLRYFTRKTAAELAKRVGLYVVRVRATTGGEKRPGWWARFRPSLFSRRFLLVCAKPVPVEDLESIDSVRS